MSEALWGLFQQHGHGMERFFLLIFFVLLFYEHIIFIIANAVRESHIPFCTSDGHIWSHRVIMIVTLVAIHGGWRQTLAGYGNTEDSYGDWSLSRVIEKNQCPNSERKKKKRKKKEGSSWSKKPEEMCREVFWPDNIWTIQNCHQIN